MTFRTSEMTQVFLIAVACSGAVSGQFALISESLNSCRLDGSQCRRYHLQTGRSLGKI